MYLSLQNKVPRSDAYVIQYGVFCVFYDDFFSGMRPTCMHMFHEVNLYSS